MTSDVPQHKNSIYTLIYFDNFKLHYSCVHCCRWVYVYFDW